MSIRTQLAAVVLFLAAGGCARTVQFKAVDAISGKPIGDVQVAVHGERDFFTLGPVHRDADLGTTSTAGTIASKDYDPSIWNQFVFSKPGYIDSRVERQVGGFQKSVLVTAPYKMPYDRTVMWTDQKVDDVVTVKMFPAPLAVAARPNNGFRIQGAQ